MWNTVLLCKSFTYLCFSIPQLFPTTVSLLRPCCDSSCSAHPRMIYVHTPKKSTSLYQPFSSRNGNKALMCFARNYTTHWHTRPTVGKTRPCTSVQHGATVTVSTYLTHLFVLPLSAVYVSVKNRPNMDAVRLQRKAGSCFVKNS